jgi:hypothetical protein
MSMNQTINMHIWITKILRLKCDATLQNFINKHIVNLENTKDKKKEKGKFTRCQVNSN